MMAAEVKVMPVPGVAPEPWSADGFEMLQKARGMDSPSCCCCCHHQS